MNGEARWKLWRPDQRFARTQSNPTETLRATRSMTFACNAPLAERLAASRTAFSAQSALRPRSSARLWISSTASFVAELWRLIDGERVGASKLDEEQVVLNEVVTKRRFGERAVCQSVREGMLGVGPPLGGCFCL